MQKYDVEQLLKQQKNNVAQSIKTIIISLGVSISASIFLIRFTDFASSSIAWGVVVVFIVIAIISPIIHFLLHYNDEITVKKEEMTLLFVFEKIANCPNLLKFNGYNFSIYTADNWKKYIQIEDNYEKVKASQNNSNYPNNKNTYFDKAISDLTLYTLLTRIRTYKHTFFRTEEYLNWIIYQNEAIKNNLFVNLIHSKQIEYEILHRDGGKNDGVYSYIPFSLTFPHDIKFKLENEDKLSFPNIVLKNDIVKITIKFHEESCFDKSFVYTKMKPGNLHKFYNEICIKMSIELDVKKYAFFRTNENNVDKYWSWANDLISNLKSFCDWEHYDKTFQRSKIQELENKLDYIKWEIDVENYHNFESNTHGRIRKLLRYTINPHFENRRDAIDQIVEMKYKIPEDVIETVVYQLLALTSYNERVTSFKAAEAFGNLADIIPTNLQQIVVDKLIELIEDDNNIDNRDLTKEYSTKSLVLLYPVVLPSLKNKIHDKIIKTCISNRQNAVCSYECHEHISLIWENMPSNKRKYYYDEYYRKILNPSEDLELIAGLIFFGYVGALVEDKSTNDLIKLLLQIDPKNNEILTNYLNTLAILWRKLPTEFADVIFSKLSTFLDHTNLDFRATVARRFFQNKFFMKYLTDDKIDLIFNKLLDFINSGDTNLKQIATQCIARTASIYTGKEDYIAILLIKEIEAQCLSNKDIIHFTNDFLDNIINKVKPKTLKIIENFKNENDTYL